MMKWLLAVVLVVLAGLGLWWQINTTKISYVNGLAAYAHLPNREFILQHDCYVFAWLDRSIGTSNPLLGVNAPGVPTSVAELPREVTRENLGRNFPGVRLLDVIPQGTRIRLLSVRREESRRTGLVISYEITYLDDVDRAYQRTDIRPILLPVSQPGEPPAIDPTVAVPWIKR